MAAATSRRKLIALHRVRGVNSSFASFSIFCGKRCQHDAKIVLMDESFGALDAMMRERLQNDLVDIWSRTGPRDTTSAEFNAWRRLLSAQLHCHHARKAD